MNKRKLLVIFPIIVLIAISLWAMRSLNATGFYTSHDGWHIVARLFHFSKSVSEGQFPPRFDADLLRGFGYPLFIFSYHLPWWLALPWLNIGADVFSAIKIIFVLTYVFSGLAMYLWIKEMWGKAAGLTAGILYLFTPYRFVNIFVRANMGEAVSFMFIPLIFWAIFRLTKYRGFKTVFLGCVGISGFLLSHIMVSFLFFIPLLLFWIVNFIRSVKKIIFLRTSALFGILGVGISAYYIFPAIYYQETTVFKEIYDKLYLRHFTPISKLLYSPWGYGVLDSLGEMSRQIGLVLWLVFILISGLLIFKLIKRSWSQKENIILVFWISFLLSLFLMLKISEPVWRMISQVAVIDFPWRFLAVTTFCGSLLGGAFVSSLKIKFRVICMTLLIVSALYTNRNHLRVNQYTDIPLSLYIESETTTNTDNEYLPKWVNSPFSKQIHPLTSPIPSEFKVLLRNSNRTDFQYSVTEPTEIHWYQMYFPGWQLFLDGSPQKLARGADGQMQTVLLPQAHVASLRYTPTAIMRIGEMITLLSVAYVIWIFWKSYSIKANKKL